MFSCLPSWVAASFCAGFAQGCTVRTSKAAPGGLPWATVVSSCPRPWCVDPGASSWEGHGEMKYCCETVFQAGRSFERWRFGARNMFSGWSNGVFIQKAHSVRFFNLFHCMNFSPVKTNCTQALILFPSRFILFTVFLQLPVGDSHQGCHEEVPEPNEPQRDWGGRAGAQPWWRRTSAQPQTPQHRVGPPGHRASGPSSRPTQISVFCSSSACAFILLHVWHFPRSWGPVRRRHTWRNTP